MVGGYRANESADLERVEADFTLWLNKQCMGLKKTLARQLHKFGKNNTRHRKVRAKALRESMHQLNHFRKASMSKAVQHSTFWRYPGKVRGPHTAVDPSPTTTPHPHPITFISLAL